MAKSQNSNIPGEQISGNPKADSSHSDTRKTGDINKKTEKSTQSKSRLRRAFEKTGYAVWITVLAIGGILAFIISLVAV